MSVDASRVDIAPTAIDVRFECGKDVLSSYWGYLAHGGLVIPDVHDIEVDQPVALNVIIASAGAKHSLRGRMLRRHPDGDRMVIAFDPGQPHDMLLTAALAETENTPARQHRRYRIDLEGVGPGRRPLRVVNVSVGGMCLTVKDEHDVATGTRFQVETEGRRFDGVVQWLTPREVGLRFVDDAGRGQIREDVLELVELYLQRLS